MKTSCALSPDHSSTCAPGYIAPHLPRCARGLLADLEAERQLAQEATAAHAAAVATARHWEAASAAWAPRAVKAEAELVELRARIGSGEM